jgi:hypothetical protein
MRAALEELKRTGSTLVIFTSNNVSLNLHNQGQRIVNWAANVTRSKADFTQTLTHAESVPGGTLGPIVLAVRCPSRQSRVLGGSTFGLSPGTIGSDR